MTVTRFYTPEASVTGRTVTLSATEAHHLTSVLRLRNGDMIRVFDGRGHEFTARVDIVARKQVTAHTLEAVEPTREPRVMLTLAQSILKGRGVDTVVHDATMLGVAAIQPIFSERTNVPRAALTHDGTLERWRKISVSSAKQCGRAGGTGPCIARPFRPAPHGRHCATADHAGRASLALRAREPWGFNNQPPPAAAISVLQCVWGDL